MSPVFVLGPFDSELEPGFQISFNPVLPLTGLVKNGNATIETGWSMMELSGSGSSYLHVLFARAGFLYQYPLHRFFEPYGAAGVQVNWFYLNTDKSDLTASTLKPGLFAEIGTYAHLYRGLGSRISLEYCALPLSGLLYSEMKVKLGVTYCYERSRGYAGTGEQTIDREISEVDEARELFRQGRIDEAREKASAVLKKEKDSKEALDLVERIARIDNAEREARRMLAEKKLLEAIPLLEIAAGYYPGSKNDLVRIRSELSRLVPDWEREGIAFYETKNYDSCIATMKKILLVDPENNTARIYLPRAQNRKRALESF